jgi:hypothetical protein
MAKKAAKRAKKSGKGVLAQAIRDEFQVKGLDTRPRDIIAALESRGIKVSPAQVSNIKTALLNPSKSKRRPGPKVDATPMHVHGDDCHEMHSLDFSQIVDALRLAKRLIERVGDVQLAHDVLDASAELQKKVNFDDDIPF